MIGDAGEHVGEIVLRVEAVELGGFDQRIECRCTAAAGVGAGEQVILAADRDAAQRPLGGIVVEGEPAVIEAAQQRLPARAHIAEGFGQFGFAGELRQGVSAQAASASAIGLRALLAFVSPPVGRQAGDRLFDPVEIADAVKRLLGDRRAVGGMDVEEFAPDMGPAGGFGDPVAGEQPVEPRIAVGVDDAAEVLEMRLWVLALAVGRVEEQRRRRPLAGERPLVADIGPQPPGLGLACARRQHRHRRVVDMQCVQP